MNYIAKFREMKKEAWNGLWSQRILSEMNYLLEMDNFLGEDFHICLQEAISELYDRYKSNGAITKTDVENMEERLMLFQPEVKKITVYMIGHAHIDMNWMWGFNETASLTVDTFETVLHLMEEYPQFKFSQSQASVYKILEEYYPELLEKVKQRIKEGRWEVSASSWVENDKNMSGEESMARHLLYTKQYLSKTLDLSPDDLQIDFEPDTFGHSANLPEILNQGGVKYYYHCRGYEGEHVYRWRAPSGAEVLVYREPVWYNDETVEYDCLSYIPGLCGKYNLDVALKLYGVGDHGGGPTRREIERIMQMQTWPLMPEICFGTLKEFYAGLEKKKEQLPVVDSELNYVFTGCYTTQARIKRINRMGESRLFESEALNTMADRMTDGYVVPSSFRDAWEKIMFNQFHDILPGSGVFETQNYAIGEFQRAMAASQINLNHAMRAMCENMDTAKLVPEEDNADWSMGAGVGFGTNDASGYLTGSVSRAKGKKRVITVFNPTQDVREEVIKVILWDWNGDTKQLFVVDASGDKVCCEVIKTNQEYWAHKYHEILLEVKVPAFGYANYVLDEKAEEKVAVEWYRLSATADNNPRVDVYTDAPIILENEKIKAIFAADNMKLIALTEKENGKALINSPSGYFRFIKENPVKEMSAWRVGPYSLIKDLNESSEIRVNAFEKNSLETAVSYEMKFENSKLRTRISLKKDSTLLDYDITVEWHEIGTREKGIPQLNFALPIGYDSNKYICGVPFGTIERKPIAHDVPCIGFMAAASSVEQEKVIQLHADSKYGFRGYDNEIAVALLRSSFDPDATPDQGEHHIRLGVGTAEENAVDLLSRNSVFAHPLYSMANGVHEGVLPLTGGFFEVDGPARVCAVKKAEKSDAIVLRLYNTSVEPERITLTFRKKVEKVQHLDVMEHSVEDLSIQGDQVKVDIGKNAVYTLGICM